MKWLRNQWAASRVAMVLWPGSLFVLHVMLLLVLLDVGSRLCGFVAMTSLLVMAQTRSIVETRRLDRVMDCWRGTMMDYHWSCEKLLELIDHLPPREYAELHEELRARYPHLVDRDDAEQHKVTLN